MGVSLYNPRQIHMVMAFVLLHIFYICDSNINYLHIQKETQLIQCVIHMSNSPNRCVNIGRGLKCVQIINAV